MPWLALIGGMLFVVPVAAQHSAKPPADQDGEIYVSQADDAQIEGQTGGTSSVYFPDDLTPENIMAARARASTQQQLTSAHVHGDQNNAVSQIENGSDGNDGIDQLTIKSPNNSLSQLSPDERQVLLEAVRGSDICDNPPAIEAIAELCRNRLETRSAEFGRDVAGGSSAEDRLLGNLLEASNLPTLESVIRRLARNSGSANDLDHQAIASVGLSQHPGAAGQASDGSGDPTGELSPETQSLINSLVQQLGGNSGR